MTVIETAHDRRNTTLALDRLIAARHDMSRRHGAAPRVRSDSHGPFLGARRGHGTEFDDLRPYVDGDDLRHIDWRSSARQNELHTRLFRAEQEHRVTIAVDLRAGMFTGSTTLRAVTAGLMAARLVWVAVNGGSRTALLSINDSSNTPDVQATQALRGERSALTACSHIARVFDEGRRQMSDNVLSERDARSSTTPLSRLSRQLLDSAGPRGSTTLLITGMDDPGEDFFTTLKTLSDSRTVAIVLVEDALDRSAPPPGRYRYTNAGSARHINLSRNLKRRIDTLLRKRRETLVHRLSEVRVPLLSTQDGMEAVVGQLRDAALLP